MQCDIWPSIKVERVSEKTSANGGSSKGGGAVIIKKYANRRLYNTGNSAYVTLDHLRDMVRDGEDFLVQDARTGEDITRSVLAQIIFEQENRGETLLPVQFLRKLIQFYGRSMQGFLPAYLEMSLETFSRSQEQIRDQFTRTWPVGGALPSFEEQALQNAQMFQQALRMWTNPIAAVGAEPPPPTTPQDAEALAELKRQMDQMQRQLDQIATTRGKSQT